MAKKKKKESKKNNPSSPKATKGADAKEEKENGLSRDVKKSITAIVLMMLACVILLSLIHKAGMVGEYVDYGLDYLMGKGRYLLPFIMIVVGIMYFRKMETIRYALAAIGGVMLLMVFLSLAHFFQAGGVLGSAMAFPLINFTGNIATVIILAGFFLIGVMLIFNAPLYQLWNRLRGKKGEDDPKKEKQSKFVEGPKVIVEEKKEEKKEKKPEEKKEEDNIKVESIKFVEGPQDEEGAKEKQSGGAPAIGTSLANQGVVKKNIYSGSNWKRPPIEIFAKSKERPHQENLEENVEIIKETLGNFGIEVSPSEYHIGPTVTQYTFKPAVGVKLSRIVTLQKDLALALAASAIRIEAPIPGKSLIGIEVPNKSKSIVRMRSMLESDVFRHKPSKLSVILGEDVNGHPILANIEKMPHLLIAGSTNTGKSVSINSLLSTLLYENSPEELRMILVDPKRVELSIYNGIPHLLTPVIVDMTKVVRTLKWAVGEMERRYKVLQEMGSRDIQSYNDKVVGTKNGNGSKKNGERPEKMPYILIVVDELADLMAAHGRDVEGLIVRLAQMARAVGIHLVISTQRPSVEVITGLIKANIITRVAFQVATQIDSRTILDMSGAEKLLGNGDLLYINAESAQPRRIQGAYISEIEVKKLVKFIKKQAKSLNLDESENLSESLEEKLESDTGIFSGSGTEGDKDEELYEQAKEIVVQANKASTSMLQRRLSIGYSRAARIVDMLEENGVVGPQDGPKAREVLIGKEPEIKYEEGTTTEDQRKREKWDEKE